MKEGESLHIKIPIRFGNELVEDRRKPFIWEESRAGDELLKDDNTSTN